MKNVTRREFIRKSSFATIAIAGLGPLTRLGAEDALPSPAIRPLIPPPNPVIIDNTAPVNQLPYISTYFIQPKAPVGKKVGIDYYVTDYFHKEYMSDDDSERFTVDYWVNGVKHSASNVKAGDNTLVIDPPPAGKVLFALQATDGKGRRSHRLFFNFLMITPEEMQITPEQTYHPDLKKFGIHDDDTHPIETTAGLTAMLKWASDNGYRKVILPKGVYRLDENCPVEMATKLTLDMNGSTFKLNPSALNRAKMLDMNFCFDSHVINGTFEGDLKEHDFDKATNNSEWLHGVHMGEGTEYSSFEDITIKDVTGYGAVTSMNPAKGFINTPLIELGKFAPGDVDAQGNVIASDVRSINAKLVDIAPFHERHGFFALGPFLGYQGNPTPSWNYIVHFYDENEKFLESMEGYLYRRVYPPAKACYARFVLCCVSETAQLSLWSIRQPENCAFINIHHENVRCVGMAPLGFYHLLVEGCTFENCGFASAKCAFDAEDGWDMMQDLIFRNNKFGKNPNNEFLTTAGHNFVMEGNVMKALSYDRTRGMVYRNNTLKAGEFYFGTRRQSGYPRVYGNTFEGLARLIQNTDKPSAEFRIRDNSCLHDAIGDIGWSKGVATNVYFYKCQIKGERIGGKMVHCVIKDSKQSNNSFDIQHSIVENCELHSTAPSSEIWHAHSQILDSTVKETQLHSASGNYILLKGNTLTDVTCDTGAWQEETGVILLNNTIQTSKEYLIKVFNSYRQVVLLDNTVTSTSPDFTAILLQNPTNKNNKEQTIVLLQNTFNASGGLVIDARFRVPEDNTLTIYMDGNKFNAIDEIGQLLFDKPNVRVVNEAPPKGLM